MAWSDQGTSSLTGVSFDVWAFVQVRGYHISNLLQVSSIHKSSNFAPQEYFHLYTPSSRYKLGRPQTAREKRQSDWLPLKSLLDIPNIERDDIGLTLKVALTTARVENNPSSEAFCAYLRDEEESSIEYVVIHCARNDVVVTYDKIGSFVSKLSKCFCLWHSDSNCEATMLQKATPSITKYRLVFYNQCMHGSLHEQLFFIKTITTPAF